MRDPRLIAAIASNHKNLCSIAVYRHEGGRQRAVDTITLADADGVQVTHDTSPAHDAGEIADLVQGVARRDVLEHGSGSYLAILNFAKGNRGPGKQPKEVSWEQGAHLEEHDEARAMERLWRQASISAWKDHHAATMEMGGLVKDLVNVVVGALTSANQMMQAAAERERTAGANAVEIEALKMQQQTESMRMGIATQALQTLAGRKADQETKPTNGTDTTTPPAPGATITVSAKDKPEDELTDKQRIVRRFVSTLSTEQRQALERRHAGIGVILDALEESTNDDQIVAALRRLHEVTAGNYHGLLAELTTEQSQAAFDLVQTLG